MKSLHGVLHDELWIRFFWIYFSNMTYFTTNCMANFKTNSLDRWTPPSISLKLIDFETYHMKPNPPLFFPPTKYATVPQHGPFSLHTMLEGPWLHKTAFPTPMVRPLDESRGPSPLPRSQSRLLAQLGSGHVKLHTPPLPHKNNQSGLVGGNLQRREASNSVATACHKQTMRQ